MLDLFLKLIEKFVDLQKRREETNKALFKDLILPAFSDFEIVHKDYVESFKRYRDLIETTEEPLSDKHVVLRLIQKDSLFTEHLRTKAWGHDELYSDKIFGGFAIAIFKYLFCVTDNDSSLTDPRSNPRRRRLSDELTDVFQGIQDNDNENALQTNQTKKQCAIEVLDEHITDIQTQFSNTVNEYAKLKKRLLKAG